MRGGWLRCLGGALALKVPGSSRQRFSPRPVSKVVGWQLCLADPFPWVTAKGWQAHGLVALSLGTHTPCRFQHPFPSPTPAHQHRIAWPAPGPMSPIPWVWGCGRSDRALSRIGFCSDALIGVRRLLLSSGERLTLSWPSRNNSCKALHQSSSRRRRAR